MTKTTLIITFLAFLTANLRADPIDDYLNTEMRRTHIQGLSLAVIKDGKVEKVAAYGLANVELDVAVTPKTVFQIQSITKTFTSTAILMLVEEGKISLDDPISKHLEGTPDSWKEIKIHHLLSHTSGIKDFINEPTTSLREEITEEQVLKATAPRPLNFQPGEKYAYSNTNYHLLAMIIRKHTGKSYGQFLKERIFDPLDMPTTRLMNWNDIIPNRASGYQWRANGLRNGDFIAGSVLAYGGGGIVSTAEDMAKWAMAAGSEKLLKRETWDKAWTGEKFNNGLTSGYGFGWGVGNVNGHRMLAHSGAHLTGFTSALVKYPNDALAIVILTNAGGANPTRIAQHVAGLYIPILMPGAQKAIEDKDPKTTQQIREIAAAIKEGNLTADPFTPDMWKILSPQLKGLQQESRRQGEIKNIELLAKEDTVGDRSYRYRLICARKAQIISANFNYNNKITGLWIEDE